MAEFPVDITDTTNREVTGPRFEFIQFSTQGQTGDWYDTKKFGRIIGAWASNITADSQEIRVTWETRANGQIRIRIHPSQNATSGYLTIMGTK